MSNLLKTFQNTYPLDTSDTGDTINLLISSSLSGSKEEWNVLGITIPSQGLNGDLKQVIENADRMYFQFNQGVIKSPQGNYYVIEYEGPYNTPGDACADTLGPSSDFHITNTFWTYLAQKVYNPATPTFSSPHNGNNKWFFVDSGNGGSEYGSKSYAYQVGTNGEVIQWCDCDDTSSLVQREEILPYYEVIIGDKKRKRDYYYLGLKNELKIPKGVTSFLDTGSIIESVFFEPSFQERIYTSEYNVLINNNEDIRSSEVFLKVDRTDDLIVPKNWTIISSSISSQNIRFSLEENLFANVQDSNYESKAWTKPRYEGSLNIAREGEFPVNFTYTSFPASIYALNATTASIVQEEKKETTSQNLFIGTLRGRTFTSDRPFVVVSLKESNLETEVTGSYYTAPGTTGTAPFDISITYQLNRYSSVTGLSTFNKTFTVSSGNAQGFDSFDNYFQENDERYGQFIETTEFSKLITTSTGSIAIYVDSDTLPVDESVTNGNTYIFEESPSNRNEFRVIPQQSIFDKRNRDLYRTNEQGLVASVTRNLPNI